MRRSNGTVLHGQLPGLLGAQHESFVVDQKLVGDDVEIADQTVDVKVTVEDDEGRTAEATTNGILRRFL